MSAGPTVDQDGPCGCPIARHRHGTRAMRVTHGCKCFACRVATANSAQAYRTGGKWHECKVDATPTRLRLRALAVAGVTGRQIAEHLGTSVDMVSKLRNTPDPRVYDHTAQKVKAAYDALWDKGFQGTDSRRCATQAVARGWLGPMALDDDALDAASPLDFETRISLMGKTKNTEYIDEIAVDEAIRGRRVSLTRAEMTEAVRRLTDMGWSAHQIADRLGTYKRAVQRDRARAAA